MKAFNLIICIIKVSHLCKYELCTSGLFRRLLHPPVHGAELILQVGQLSVQIWNGLDVFGELADLLLQLRVELLPLFRLPLQADDLFFQTLYLLFQRLHLLLVVLFQDLNVVFCNSAENDLMTPLTQKRTGQGVRGE